MSRDAWRARVLLADERPSAQLVDGVLEHRVDWLLLQCDRPDKAVLVLEYGKSPPIPLFVHDGQIDLNLGELTIGYFKVRRHVLVGNFSESVVENWEEPLTAFSRFAPRDAALFLLGVVRGEALDCALQQSGVRKRFFVLCQGGGYKRRTCEFFEGFDAYLGSLSSNSRKSMKRSLKRFEAHFRGCFALDVYQDLAGVTQFLERVEPVSKRTYQGRLLGLAVTSDGDIGNKIVEGARLGCTRCYLLTVDGKPISWRIGFVSDRVFCSHHVGYDPDYEEWHPGVLMHLYSLKHLMEIEEKISSLDFLYGDNDFKRRASNRSRDEQNYYLFPRNFRGAMIYTCLSMSNFVSEFIGRVLERIGLKAKLKAALRRG